MPISFFKRFFALKSPVMQNKIGSSNVQKKIITVKLRCPERFTLLNDEKLVLQTFANHLKVVFFTLFRKEIKI
jgi:hypothetical protein